ncbi:MAG: hypothetical protein ACI9DF_006114, partial [Verrucomicrobiales bacterium]
TPPPNDVCEDVPRLLAGLPEGDREVVIARYLDEKSFRTIARELRVSEDTAQKRTSRALEKMRKKLSARGIAGAATLIAETLAYQRVASVPAAVLTRVQTMAFEPMSRSILQGWLQGPIKTPILACCAIVLAVFGLHT